MTRWLHDDVLDFGVWSPRNAAQPIIAPALEAMTRAVVIDASTITRFWFDRANPTFEWRTDAPTYRPSGAAMFLESRAPTRIRVRQQAFTSIWPWLYRRWGLLMVATDLERVHATSEARRAAALHTIRTVEAWEPGGPAHSTDLDDPRWTIALYLVGDRGQRAPGLIGAGVIAVGGDGRIVACDSPNPDHHVLAARVCFVPKEPRTPESDVHAAETFERLLAPLLFANACLFAENDESSPMVAVTIGAPTLAEQRVPGPTASRHLHLHLAGLAQRLDHAGAAETNGLASALSSCSSLFARRDPDAERISG